MHLTPSGLRAINNGTDPNPFRNHFNADWTGLGMYQIAKEVKLTRLYSRLMDPYSDWVHWSPKGIMKSTSTSPGEFQFSFLSYYQACTALVAGGAALIGVLRVWQQAHGIGIIDGLDLSEAEFADHVGE